MRVLAIFLLSAALTGCGQSSNTDPKGPIGSTSSAATGGAGAPLEEEPEFPLQLEVTKEFVEGAQVAAAYSDVLDEKCTLTEMSADLDTRRPVVAGKKLCPRPEGAPETWGAN